MSKRIQVGGSHGFTINKVIAEDAHGNVLSTFYEIVSPSGEILSPYWSIDAAEAAILAIFEQKTSVENERLRLKKETEKKIDEIVINKEYSSSQKTYRRLR